jgi:hypothetical protein
MQSILRVSSEWRVSLNSVTIREKSLLMFALFRSLLIRTQSRSLCRVNKIRSGVNFPLHIDNWIYILCFEQIENSLSREICQDGFNELK